MKARSLDTKGFALIELLLLTAIIILVATFVLRIVFASALREWDNNLFASLGIHPDVGRTICGVAALVFVVWLASKKKRHSRAK